MNPVTGFFTVTEAAVHAGLSYATVSRDVREKVIPSVKIGRMHLITPANLERYRQSLNKTPA